MGMASLIRHTTILFILLAVGLALVLFSLKYEVRALEEELSSVRGATADERRAIHVLNAEWNHLTTPDRLVTLAGRHLDLEPTRPAQVGAIEDLPPPGRVARSGESAPQ